MDDVKETKMPSELSAAEIEKVLADWYCDLALDTGLDFGRVAETIAALARERQRTILPADGPADVVALRVSLGMFATEWLKASPLVRAATAGWLVGRVDEMEAVEVRAAERYARRVLVRRTRICAQGAELSAAISDLFVALCRQADDEADRLGVPGDARP